MGTEIRIPSWKEVKNFVFPTTATSPLGVAADYGKPDKDLSNYITPVQLERLRHDINMWRNAVKEMEAAWYPQRVKAQRMLIDTILNGHVKSCMRKRRRLTMQRQFMFGREIAEDQYQEDVDITRQFKKTWFKTLIKYIIDAEAFGYSLIALGDIVDGEFPNIRLVRRWNVSPERENVTSMIYSLSGANFLQEPYADWHVWVTTDNENGTANCGYGYLYEVALYEIVLRNLLGFNGDFVEMFAQPYRVGKTTKTDAAERDKLEAALQNMGSAGYAVIDPNDDIAFLETRLGSTGFLGYDNLEARCEKKISKLILGHSDALDSTPGKLGSGQGGQESPVGLALSEVQSEDGATVENVINNQVLPKLKNLGFVIPDGIIFKFKNDDEMAETRSRKDDSDQKTANIAVAMKSAGLQMEANYFTERTGIPCDVIPGPAPTKPGDKQQPNKVKKQK
jgi:hypothetical protein